MAHLKKLPWELIEEILSRVPPKSLVRFRTVSKQWNALFDDKAFINNHKMTFRFIVATESKIYSVSIDPVIVVRELTLGTPGLESLELKNLVDCNELLLCGKNNGAVVWNPWLGQSTWIEPSLIHSGMGFDGIGYDNNNYKIAASSPGNEDEDDLWTTYDFPSDVWTDHDSEPDDRSNYVISVVSLNGTLYWVSFYDMNDPLCYVTKFDFSSGLFIRFCDLPCGRNHHDSEALVLGVFRGDRFSLLKQCMVTKKIEIWVTENKINENGTDVVWMNFMTFSSPNLPDLVETVTYTEPSYFIEDKRLVVCSCDNTGHAWIYILGDNKLICKNRIDCVVDPWPLHCTFVPSLVPVPARCRREERAELLV
ncbi:Galactose oxidase/kelch beta-propeller [Arabidopsis thaliana x Arabidopsis arenosa]|uniref:Galactose oxidase/kelch beta-propeller n=1 Tax=Arabidopsis thaliana x Arabidopsis arenosa TaxID=1240361 RepID=A0A8T2AYE8_9BRAS|nr:Galactose oxidase/kelch beta-propeller [Arabidopsis thaliana x Arabidopsis arenosa]